MSELSIRTFWKRLNCVYGHRSIRSQIANTRNNVIVLSGEENSGKTECVWEWMRAVDCAYPDGDYPCGFCQSCRKHFFFQLQKKLFYLGISDRTRFFKSLIKKLSQTIPNEEETKKSNEQNSFWVGRSLALLALIRREFSRLIFLHRSGSIPLFTEKKKSFPQGEKIPQEKLLILQSKVHRWYGGWLGHSGLESYNSLEEPNEEETRGKSINEEELKDRLDLFLQLDIDEIIETQMSLQNSLDQSMIFKKSLDAFLSFANKNSQSDSPVVVIDPIEKISPLVAPSLLKILEEPPENFKIFLLSRDSEKLPFALKEPLLSRAVNLRFGKLSDFDRQKIKQNKWDFIVDDQTDSDGDHHLAERVNELSGVGGQNPHFTHASSYLEGDKESKKDSESEKNTESEKQRLLSNQNFQNKNSFPPVKDSFREVSQSKTLENDELRSKDDSPNFEMHRKIFGNNFHIARKIRENPLENLWATINRYNKEGVDLRTLLDETTLAINCFVQYQYLGVYRKIPLPFYVYGMKMRKCQLVAREIEKLKDFLERNTIREKSILQKWYAVLAM